jgi:hypothetical protein
VTSTAATSTSPHVAEVFYMGTHKAIDALRNPDASKFDTALATRADLKEALTELINLEIQAEPNIVGPPVKVLAIGKSGPTWIAGGEGCPLQ